jgi:hypothetical protein
MSKQTELVGLARTTNLDEVNAAYSAGALSNRNLIINGGFDVWQRGISFVSDGYTADRFTSQASATIARVTDSPSGFKYSAKVSGWDGVSGYQINQRIENNGQFYAGQKLTISCWVKGDSPFMLGNLGTLYALGLNVAVSSSTNNYQVTTSWTRYAVTTTLADVDYNLMTSLMSYPVGNFTQSTMASTNTLYVTGFQIEVGDTATPFEHRSHGQELALCQRFYYRRTYESYAYQYVNNGRVTGQYGTTNRSLVETFFQFPVTMRSSSTISYSSANSFRINNDFADETASGISSGISSPDSQVVLFTKPSTNLNGGSMVYVNRQNLAASCWIAFDAEL